MFKIAIVTAIVTVIIIGIVTRFEIKRRRWSKAFDLRKDMYNKFLELAADPCMSDLKWKEWLPIFEDVDVICARDCPDMKFDRIALKIKRIINNRETIGD